MSALDVVKSSLQRQGISDVHGYLEKLDGVTGEYAFGLGNGQTWIRGNVHMMLGRIISRKSVDERLTNLKFL